MMAFDRILVGVDGSPASLIALRQAIRLRAADGHLCALTIVNSALAVHAGFEAPRAAAQLHAAGMAAREAAIDVVAGLGRVETRLIEGRPGPAIRSIASRDQFDLIAVGSHGGTRTGGTLLASVATELVHQAHCSVLLTRPSEDPTGFPRQIVVGVDGSDESQQALSVAIGLATRLDAELRVIAAEGGKHIDRDEVCNLSPTHPTVFVADAPVDALVAASRDTDLVIIGSRGLHGPRALGSVSERVAHQADCSVLIIRPDGNAISSVNSLRATPHKRRPQTEPPSIAPPPPAAAAQAFVTSEEPCTTVGSSYSPPPRPSYAQPPPLPASPRTRSPNRTT